MSVGPYVGAAPGETCAHCGGMVRHEVVAVICDCPPASTAAQTPPPIREQYDRRRRHACGCLAARYERQCPTHEPRTPKGTRAAPAFRDKICTGCGQAFTPTGPRALRCATCRGNGPV